MMHHSVLYVSHGGGPLPLLNDPAHREMSTTLQQIKTLLPLPDAIVVISAHWESDSVAITAAAQPTLLYDYHGFDEAAYQLRYPCPGHPELANIIAQALQQAGIKPRLEKQRGLDHGVFVPLIMLYPEARVPVVQVSLHTQLAADFHIRLGQAMRDLPDKLLFIGSGFSFHNMRAFFHSTLADDKNIEFERWLQHMMTSKDMSEAQRRQHLLDWQQAPHARYCHPREEHLLPLHVCYGLTERPCQHAFQANILHKQASYFLW
ncbi:dioxygenase [Bacterioplanes sanyensis]|uniref:Dioxygenase n=2 Tax=Bacterioplanes sanyensis TaxID=1249553 RepID=A0A222FM36_9GAMM|nr:dioxygenase [Bacterioplanes sanyensis]